MITIGLIITIYLCMNYKKINHKKCEMMVKDIIIREKYNSWDTQHLSWLFLPAFLMRRLVFVAIPLYVTHPAFQLMILLKLSLLSIYYYSHTKPHDN